MAPKPKVGAKACLFTTLKPEPIQVETTSEVDGKTEIIRDLIYKEVRCENPPNGINGFCFDHSYPLLKPVTKRSEFVVEKWVKAEGHPPQKVSVNKTDNVIYNIGEHLPSAHFTTDEAELYFKDGFVGKRLAMDDVLTNKKAIDLDEADIIRLLVKPADEIVAVIETTYLSEATLKRILVSSTAPIVEIAVKARLKS